jgi:hypothetical protein
MQYRLTITSADAIGEPKVNLLTGGDLVDQCPWTATLIGEYFHMDLYIGLEHFCIEPVPEASDFEGSSCPGQGQSNRSSRRELASVN